MPKIDVIPESMLAPFGPLWYGDNGVEWDTRFGDVPDNLADMVNEELLLEVA